MLRRLAAHGVLVILTTASVNSVAMIYSKPPLTIINQSENADLSWYFQRGWSLKGLKCRSTNIFML